MIVRIKIMQITYLDIWSMLLSGQVSHTMRAIQVTYFGILKTLCQFLPYRRKITHHPLLIGYFHKLIWMQDVGYNTLHLHVTESRTSITQILCTSESSPINDKDPQLNRQFPFGIDLNKILPDLLILRTKAEKPNIQFSQHIPYRCKQSKRTV